MPDLAHFIAHRIGRLIIVVLSVAAVNFAIIHFAPGDAAEVLAGEAGAGDTVYVEELRERLGLDQPFGVQLWRYMTSLVTGDLGHSFRHNKSVLDLIAERLPATMILVGTSITMAVLIGTALGLIAGFWRGRWPDSVISLFALLGYATPLFWLGLILVIVFSVQLGVLPSSGIITIGSSHTGLAYLADLGRHLLLPSITLGLFYLAIYVRIVRASTLDILEQDFVRVARAKGVSDVRLALAHVLRNALLPVLTIFGVQFAAALGGAVVVEVVFGWPGVGRLAHEALLQRDVNLLLGILFFSAVLVSLVNLTVDILYSVVDPRIRLQ